MTAISDYQVETAKDDAKVLDSYLSPLALRGLFGFGILSIALAQAAQGTFAFHIGTADQVFIGLFGGTVGAIIGAKSSRRPNDRG